MSKEIMDYGFGVIETRERFYTEQYVNELKQQIAELEEQLENAIIPKFKKGDKVYVNSVDYWKDGNPIFHTTQEEIEDIMYNYKLKDYNYKVWFEEQIYKSQEEAEERLRELGENK